MTNTSAIGVGEHVTMAESARSHVRLSSLTRAQRLAWETLSDIACEPNAFLDPAFSLSTLRLPGESEKRALLAFGADGQRMTGFLTVDSAWRALRMPVPVLVAAQAYTTLTSPLLVADDCVAAAFGLIEAAAEAGARVIVLPKARLDGPAMNALREASERNGLELRVDGAHERAMLTASGDAETRLHEALGGKRRKELRRQRNRLEDMGRIEVSFVENSANVLPALHRFLALEVAGWKGRRGTGLGQHAEDTAFAAALAASFSARGAFTVAELTLNGQPLASGLVLRSGRRAFLFKIAYDESYARYSPGVQLTLELTRRFIADPRVSTVDSAADANHPMIDHVWRERLPIGDVYISTRPGDLAAPALIALLRTRARLRARLKVAYHFSRDVLERLHERNTTRR